MFTIDGWQVTNFDEGDDVFMIEWSSDVGEPLIGADGCAIVSVLAGPECNHYNPPDADITLQ